jgi:cytochrome c-type biogenesis protein CcmH/NrfF
VNTTQELILLGVAVIVLIVAVLLIQNRRRRDRKDRSGESPYATSTEGEKRCPNCGMFNLWTDRTCISCKRPLPG